MFSLFGFQLNRCVDSSQLETPENVTVLDYTVYAVFSFAPQTEHFPSAVIFGCSLTSFLQIPHFTFFTSTVKSMSSGV
jgi:hypothetical protein